MARRADGPVGSLRVLVVNQTATMSGGEHSLLTLLAALDARDARIAVASPVGDLSQRCRAGHEARDNRRHLGQLSPRRTHNAPRALAVTRRSAQDAMLVIAGSAKFTGAAARFDNAAFAESLPLLTRRLGLGEAVNLLGEVDDVPGVLAALDVLLVPSWEEAFGRVVVEGMSIGLPVIATASVGGPRASPPCGSRQRRMPARCSRPTGPSPAEASS